MATISDQIKEEIQEMIRKDLENTADRVKRRLVRASKEALDAYYGFPEGDYYVRTEKFKNLSFKPYEKKSLSNPDNMKITVGVIFERDYEYAKAGVDSETIYTWNLAGLHGGNGNSGDILDQVSEVADSLAD